jgi:alkylation response protein AidB-like acyl-CoA dehydrogenase
MEPYDSPEEARFRSQARAFLSAHADPVPPTAVSPSAIVAEWKPEEEEGRLAEARAWQRLKYDNGWAGISWPEIYGGRGGTLIQQLIFGQEEAGSDVPHDALAIGLNWCGPAVMQHGSEEQRQRWLRPLLRGDEMWSQLFSEPGAGSDLAGLGTRAVRDGDEWMITGQKVWTTFAHRSDWGLCIARHDPEQPKHRGMTAFAVDMRASGITCKPLRQMTESSNFNEVFLDEVRVPDTDRVGDVGDGWRVVITTFMWERLSLVFGSDRIVGALRRLIRERGRADDPAVRQRFARIYAGAEALRFTGLRLLTAVSQGQMPGPEGSIMKLATTSLLTDLYDLAVDVFDAEGMLAADSAPWAGEWHAGFLGMPGLRIGGGTDLVQRNIIGERVLGLPGDIRVDADVPWSKIPG